jgi:hypothetical protein
MGQYEYHTAHMLVNIKNPINCINCINLAYFLINKIVTKLKL